MFLVSFLILDIWFIVLFDFGIIGIFVWWIVCFVVILFFIIFIVFLVGFINVMFCFLMVWVNFVDFDKKLYFGWIVLVLVICVVDMMWLIFK